jgi:hypothetical protein
MASAQEKTADQRRLKDGEKPGVKRLSPVEDGANEKAIGTELCAGGLVIGLAAANAIHDAVEHFRIGESTDV